MEPVDKIVEIFVKKCSKMEKHYINLRRIKRQKQEAQS